MYHESIHEYITNAFDWYRKLPELDKLVIQTNLSSSLYHWITCLQQKFHSRKPLPAPLQEEKTTTQPLLNSPQEVTVLVSTVKTALLTQLTATSSPPKPFLTASLSSPKSLSIS